MRKEKILILLFLLSSFLIGNELNNIVGITEKANHHSINSQKKIDLLVNEKEKIYNSYRKLSSELKSLNNYNLELEQVLESQNKEVKSILKQIRKIDETKREIYPLIKNMIISLEEFIKNDTPFLCVERTQRINRLKKLLKRSDVNIATKYRAIIEAYEIENEYGKTIETYNGILNDKSLKFLRIGRIALYYVAEDNSNCAIWDNDNKKWQKLDNKYIFKLNKAIKIASKKSVPDLLNLPMYTPKGAK